MHPYFSAALAEQHRSEALADAERRRLVRQAKRGAANRPAGRPGWWRLRTSRALGSIPT
jgi:hypothetical protein